MKGTVAYKDEEFLDSDEARPLRILAEYLEPLRRFRQQHVHDTIVFFGSARLAVDGPLGRYYREARELARLITAWSKHLPSHERRYVVCSGGGGGIMEAANRGASDAGGRGTLDEMTELLTLVQTGKLDRRIPILLYGSSYWNEIINFDALVRHDMISAEDLGLFQFADDPATALGLLQAGLAPEPAAAMPAFARSRTPPRDGD